MVCKVGTEIPKPWDLFSNCWAQSRGLFCNWEHHSQCGQCWGHYWCLINMKMDSISCESGFCILLASREPKGLIGQNLLRRQGGSRPESSDWEGSISSFGNGHCRGSKNLQLNVSASPPTGISGQVLSASLPKWPWGLESTSSWRPLKVFSLRLSIPWGMPLCTAAHFGPGGSAPTPLGRCGRHLLCRSPRGTEATWSEGIRGQVGEGMPTPEPQASKQNCLDPHRQSPVSSVFGPECPVLPCQKSVTRHGQEENATCPTVLTAAAPSHLVPQPSHRNNKRCK